MERYCFGGGKKNSQLKGTVYSPPNILPFWTLIIFYHTFFKIHFTQTPEKGNFFAENKMVYKRQVKTHSDCIHGINAFRYVNVMVWILKNTFYITKYRDFHCSKNLKNLS